jgi:ABC-type branched-subunit amino acid transport system substrate-binding protein
MNVRSTLMAGCVTLLLMAVPAVAQKKYDIGVSDTEIKIGQTMPYSGPASAYGTIGRAEAAYFQMVNDQGGINGRKIALISLDDGYSPAKTVEQIRRLVEQDQVLLIYQSLGTPTNTAIQRYLNAQKVPQLFVATGATKWGDPKNYPWTMGWQPSYHAESVIYARYILQNKPEAKIAVLYQNDDYGKDYLNSLRAGLGTKARLIVKQVSYEVTDPSVESQIVTLQAAGADTFFLFATPKFAAQAIRKTYDIGWRPLLLVNNVSNSVGSVLQPAGLEKAEGLISSFYLKDPTDPQWSKDKGFKDWVDWMKKYYPQGDLADIFNVYGYTVAQSLVQVLQQCGEDLTRENVMRQAVSLKNFDSPMLLPGVRINTGASDYYPIEQMQLARFDGKRWVLFGEVLTGR